MAFAQDGKFTKSRSPSGNGVALGVIHARKNRCCSRTKNRGMVLDFAAHHLCNEHTEFTNDFNLARSCAEIGLTEKIKKSRVFYERSTEHGTEQKEPR